MGKGARDRAAKDYSLEVGLEDNLNMFIIIGNTGERKGLRARVASWGRLRYI